MARATPGCSLKGKECDASRESVPYKERGIVDYTRSNQCRDLSFGLDIIIYPVECHGRYDA